jgi:mRNA interferase MazF
VSNPDRGEVWLDIVTISHAKLIRKLGNLTSEQMSEVEETLSFWLGLAKEIDEDDEETN